VRLAAKLLGWKIDIKSEEEKRQEVEQQMASLVNQSATPLDRVPDLGEPLILKLNEAGITTVEALADMTPEQLEELPGVGPKTVEKISLAVNNYFSSFEAAAPEGEAPAELDAVESASSAEGEVTTPAEQQEKSEYAEAEETGQAYEAEVLAGVENAPPADVAEVHTHGDNNEETAPGEVAEPERSKPGHEPGE